MNIFEVRSLTMRYVEHINRFAIRYTITTINDRRESLSFIYILYFKREHT